MLDSLCPPRLYFPLQLQTSLPGGFFALEQGSPGGACVFELDAERARYLANKRGRASLGSCDAGSQAAIASAAHLLSSALRAEQPALHAQAGLAGASLDRLAQVVQEDVVVMAREHGAQAVRARACYLHVCAPSGWRPERMLGKNFLALHARVPRLAGFSREQRSRSAAQLFTRAQVRFVWTLTPDPGLDHHPDRARVEWPDARQIFLRVERQVVLPVEAPNAAPRQAPEAAVFLIRVYVYPRQRLSASQCSQLRAAVSGMPLELRHYKGFAGHESRICALLAAAPATHS